MNPLPETPETPAEAPPRRFWLVLVIAVAVILLDQGTKWWAEASLEPGVSVPFIGELIRFQLVYNPGAAFSIGTDFTWIFAILAALGAVAVVGFAWRVRSWAWAVSLGLLLGGAITHLGDRLFREPGFGIGHVVDFIAYGNWFIGNVADIAIFAGAVLLLVLSFTGVRRTA